MVTKGPVSVAVVVPARDGEPAVGAAETVAEALELAGGTDAVTLVVIGTDPATAHGGLADAGFGDVAARLVDAGAFAPAAWARRLAGLVTDADVVLLPASTDGRDLAPRLAATMARGLVAGAVTVAADHALVPRAGGRALAEVPVHPPVVATLQPSSTPTQRVATGAAVTPEVVDGPSDSGEAVDAEVLGVDAADAATMDLSEAPFILGAGAGLGTPDRFADLNHVAARLGASVGATRVVTDEGWIGHDRQIGTTGVVVDPTTYVAFGISGAVQHTSGLGAPDHVISVNTDPHCPMMQLSDLAVVADAPAVVAELRRRLDAATADGSAPGASDLSPSDPAASTDDPVESA